MSPTESQLDRRILARFDQAAEPGIAIHLQGASERSQVRDRVLASAILGVDVGRCRVSRTGPRSIIARVAPVPSVTFVQLAFKLTERAVLPGATSVALVPRAPAVDMCPGGRPRRMPNRKLRLRAPVQVPAGVVVARVTNGGRS